MRLVLKEEVYNVGRAGDVVEVADGYGRNYLVPAGIAIPATEGALRQAEALRRAREAAEAETLDDAEEAREEIETRTMTIPKRMDEGGHLYGSVTRGDIQQVLRERGHRIDERKIDLSGTIKEIGTFEIPVEVHPQVTATVTVEVVDVEGKVTVEGEGEGEEITVDVDEEAVSEAAAAAAEASEGSLTDAEALAEQALQAARDYEEQQKARAVEEGTSVGEMTPEEQEAADEHDAGLVGDETGGDETGGDEEAAESPGGGDETGADAADAGS